MSFMVAAVTAFAVNTYVQYDNGQKQQSAQRDAQAQALKSSQDQAALADQANNRANGKKPNVAGLLSENAMAAKGGIGGTMLTGPTGISPNDLTLGRTTLLGN
jgi:hypothetical protein